MPKYPKVKAKKGPKMTIIIGPPKRAKPKLYIPPEDR